MWAYHRVSLKDICYDVMQEAYARASDDGRLPTHWRQVFYVARPLVDQHPESDRELTDTYFKSVMEEYLEKLRPGWDILYGARGVLKEPHDPDGDQVLALSTADVRRYLANQGKADSRIRHIPSRFPTAGSENRYGAVLICEKEGFDELLKAAQVPERYDLALMSTKGISARAARDLAGSLNGVRCFTLHDMDKNGFVMASGFPFATDIGIRLEDVQEWNLEPEPQHHKNRLSTYLNLKKNGATDEEAQFVADGERVELNMLTSPQFVEFVERKLEENGVEKVVPDEDALARAWERAQLAVQVNALIDTIQESKRDLVETPEDLEERVRARLDDEPELSWDEALMAIVDELVSEDE